MRPRLARRGELPAFVGPTVGPKSFNAAPARSPGRTSTASFSVSTGCWGFNAAPARSPGRTSTAISPRAALGVLQCGPGSLAGENKASRQFAETFEKMLQCGPGSLAGENPGIGLKALHVHDASMRPRLARRGEP